MNKFIIAITFFITLNVYIQCVKFSYVNMLNNGPLPIGGGCSRAINNRQILYFGGGIEHDFESDGANTFENNLWRFTYNKHNKTGYWTLLEPTGPIPSARSFCSMDIVFDSQNKQYACVLGGGTFQGLELLSIQEDYFHCYDIELNTWINLSGFSNEPGPRIGALLRTLDNTLYVTGGVRSDPITYYEFLNDLYAFNFDTQTWTQLPGGEYYPRYDFRGEFLLKGENDWRLVITAGETLMPDYTLGYTGETWEYDVFSQTWKFITDQEPNPVTQGTCITRDKNNKKFITFGGDEDGYSENCEAQDIEKNLTNEVYEYQISTSNWSLRQLTGNSIIPKKIKRHECENLDGDILIFAGWEMYCPTNTTYVQSHLMDMYDLQQ